ncbi:MAG: hypothetical protein HY711_09050 [Candidatus Melainabacteria bacterium]|nr:hypothetical protein [Candidatus Melainabacteria bacterium]
MLNSVTARSNMERICLAFVVLTLVTGCSRESGGAGSSQVVLGGGSGVLGSLRPKADPAVLAKVQKDEESARQVALAQQGQLMGADLGIETNTQAYLSGLPQVGTSSISGQMTGGPIVSAAEPAAEAQAASVPFAQLGPEPDPATVAAQAQVASYGGFYGGPAVPPPPPGSGGGGLVPPPPAVTLSTQAQPMPYGSAPVDAYGNPYYGNPYYANQYANPAYATQPAQQVQAPARPALFGSGLRNNGTSGEGEDASSWKRNKKLASFVPITPTGMETRSGYKQRDDLKVLWKGALAQSPLQKLAAKDNKVSGELDKIDVSLPTESTKGSFAASQRQVEAVFKPIALDKRIAPTVKKLQSDLVQAYYRYLYTFNKFALAEQTVAARKQEMEVSGSAAEEQRAAADLSQAQSEADSAKEDMRASQLELASAGGSQAARTIIGRVSGIAPSVESLASGDSTNTASSDTSKVASSGGGGLGSWFGFGKPQKKDPTVEAEVGVAQATTKADSKKKGKKAGSGNVPDVATSREVAQAPAASSSVTNEAVAVDSPAVQPIAFQLKDVSITPRKSVLKVSIRNTGSDNFSFNPEGLTVSEGNHLLSEATVRADFDTTLVKPNQEVSGIITIFGRPWNDRLSVALTDGGRNVQLRR